MIVLFGATGYTGGRVAQAMVRRGLRPILAGRNTARLEVLASRLGNLDFARADVADPTSVRRLIGRDDVLVSTVGPFIRLGEPALRAAVEAGATYFDSTGEPPFIRRVFEEFGPVAQRTGASLITAFGHDYVPGNLAGALALHALRQPVRRMEVVYLISGVGRAQAISGGTFGSAAGLITEQSFTWRDGGIQPESTASQMRIVHIAGTGYPVVAVGATEHYALPRLAAAAGWGEISEVDVYLGRRIRASRSAQLFCQIVPALLALPGVRPLAGAIGRLAQRFVAEEPDPDALTQVSSHVVATAYDASGTEVAQVGVQSGDPYQLTADLLAWGAQRAAEHGVSGPGALGPAEAFGLDALVAGAHEVGLHRC
jgi:short subunit dehydrogenase-like uncharacterized protein